MVISTPGIESEVDEVSGAVVDSDWAGCRRCRKSTCGGALAVGGMAVKTGSSAQIAIAASIGGASAEYYALTRGFAESLGLASDMQDLG